MNEPKENKPVEFPSDNDQIQPSVMNKSPKKISKKVLVIFFALVVIGLVELALIAWQIDKPSGSDSHKSSSPATATFDKSKYATNESSSIWVVVNKGRILPTDYAPKDLVIPDVPLNYSRASNDSHLRKEAASALENLFTSAETKGYKLKLFSGYRSYDEQVLIYGNFVKSQGQAQADTFSARPGHSEHQTGLAADVSTLDRVCELSKCFGDTPAGKWLSANSYKFGFIVRYQKDNEDLTGYDYEPWHLRYIAKPLAAQIQKKGQTLEQFFGLPAYTSYPTSSYQLKK